MREMSVAEQRYQAVLAVVSDGESIKDTAARFGVSRQTLHAWLAKYEAGGMENLGDRSHQTLSCPHQMNSMVEAEIARMRATHPSWGPRRIVFELAKQDVVAVVPSESAVYRALRRLNLIDPAGRRRRDRKWKRWERGTPMELWQLDVVGGFLIADGAGSSRAKALTGLDDHSRFCVSAHLMLRETSGTCAKGWARRCGPMGCRGRS
jgi:transposase